MIITVRGTPAPQGSKRAVIRGKRAFVVDDNERTLPWREAVKHAALWQKWETLTGPVAVDALFLFVRPKSHYRTGRNAGLIKDSAPRHPAGKPDLDKLLRSTFDALTDAGVWRDDSQVVKVTGLKRYVDDVAGAELRIDTLDGAA